MRTAAQAFLIVAAFLGVGQLFLVVQRRAESAPAAPAPVSAPPHGGCVLNERFGPEVKVCRDGTVWHGKVDGPEFMGTLDQLRPILVPAAS